MGNRALDVSGGSLCPVLLRDSPCPGPWGYRHGGWRPAGRGNSFPLPCLSCSQISEYLTDPIRVPCRWVSKELAGLPRPAPGQGQCVAISGEQPCPGWSRWETVSGGVSGEQPYPEWSRGTAVFGLSPVYPRAPDRGGYRHWGRRPGDRSSSPGGTRAVCLPDTCGLKPPL